MSNEAQKKQERLEKALRDNLRRRKQAARKSKTAAVDKQESEG